MKPPRPCVPRVGVVLFGIAAWTACAADEATPRRAPHHAPAPRPAAPTPTTETSAPVAVAAPVASVATAAPTPIDAPPPPPHKSGVRIKGLTGTLNKDDVDQTMEARQAAFDECIAQGRRRLRWISGAIRFAFAVGADGTVEEVHPVESTVGHWTLEKCLYDVTAASVFPKPAGRATARFEWTVMVEPAGGRWPAMLDATIVERPLRRHGPRVASDCDLKRREHLQVTAYVTPRGRVISAGAVAKPPAATEKVECVLDAISKWRLARVARTGKVSFALH